MRFSIFLPLQMPRPWSEADQTQRIREAIEQAELADRLGFHCVWTQEHHFLEEYSHAAAPEVLLAAISQRTSQIRLGHGVMLMVPAYNHPVRAAERIAMLDHISGGRVEWGMGASGTAVELDAFGIAASEKHAQWGEGAREALRLLIEEPYSGAQSSHVKIPARNLIPKSVQKPHPPLWMPCANRGSVRHAAQNQMGALTFAFIDADEAKYWVDEYYNTYLNEGRPIGAIGNPNIAMLSNFFCHSDRETAIRLGQEGAEFFAWGLRHYFQTNDHQPAETDLWQAFQNEPERPFVSLDRFNTPDGLAAHYRTLEEAGVDEVILLQQAGNYRHEDICASLELFAAAVLPEFKARQATADERHAARLSANNTVSKPATRSSPTPKPPGHLLHDLLVEQAEDRAGRIAFEQIDDHQTASLSYGDLRDRVEALSHHIAGRVGPGAKVAVIGESGAEFVVALLAIIRAGATAIPTPGARKDWKADRVLSILSAATPQLVIGASSALSAVDPLLKTIGIEPDILALDLAAMPASNAGSDLHPPAEIAMIQYTSGSTSAPKGVPISQTMIFSSLENIEACFQLNSADRFLTFLPLHHTLALMVHVLAAIRCGGTCYTMHPSRFVDDHMSWLKAISEKQITVSAAPVFAYARLCSIDENHDGPLDLSSWRLAICGGEPVNAEIMRRFADRWKSLGFAPSAITASYGLTEGTGTVTGSPPKGLDLVTLADGRTAVSNGQVVAGVDLRVVDPETGAGRPEGRVGEIWLQGTTIAQTYLTQDITDRFVEVKTRGGSKSYLRTGDLGALQDGQLLLTGRTSDTIIVRGENVYPQDVEAIAAAEMPQAELAGIAACGLPDASDGTETLCILIETEPTPDLLTHLQTMRDAVAIRLGVRPARIAAVARGGLPRAPIGKLLRREAADAFAKGNLPILSELGRSGPTITRTADQSTVAPRLRALFAEALGLSEPEAVDASRSFFAHGGDSLLAAQTLSKINEVFQTRLSLADHVTRFSVDALAADIDCHGGDLAPDQSTALLADHADYRIEMLTEAHIEDAAECLAEAFLRLPMVKIVDVSKQDLNQLMLFVTASAAAEGLSIVATHKTTGSVVAVGICDAYLEGDEANMPPLPERLMCLLTVQMELDQRYLHVAGVPGRLLHMNLLAVDRQHEGNDLPQQMIEATLSYARTAGFEGAIAHAASPVVQQLLQSHFGFVKVAALRLQEYEYEGEHPFARSDKSETLILMQRVFSKQDRPL